MVYFETLKIEDGTLKIVAKIRSDISGVTIKKVKIKSSEVDDTGNFITLYTSDDIDDTIYNEEFKSIGLLSDIDNNIFIVEVITEGTPTVEQPCGKDKSVISSAVYNKCVAYNDILSSAKEVLNECETPKNLIDAILRFKLIECCIATNRTVEAVNYYKLLYKSLTKQITTRRCGCHGRTL